MRRIAKLCALLAALAAAPWAAHADDMDGWCAQVKKASSIVICSNAELRQQAIARNKLFDAARAKLGPEAYKALTEDQQRWIRAYTARCGVSIDDPPPTLPIASSVIDCYRRESRARTAALATRLSEPNPLASTLLSSPSPTAAAPNPFNQFDGPPRGLTPTAEPWKARLDEWMNCLASAANALAGQPEPAETVAAAAFGSCSRSEVALSDVTSSSLVERLKKETTTPQLLARVMAIRQARNNAATAEASAAQSKTVQQDLDDWIHCTTTAVAALADQPESAQTVTNAVFGSCLSEQFAYQKSAGLTDSKLEQLKHETVAPRVLAEVMAARAARAKLREQAPEKKPAVDYGKM